MEVQDGGSLVFACHYFVKWHIQERPVYGMYRRGLAVNSGTDPVEIEGLIFYRDLKRVFARTFAAPCTSASRAIQYSVEERGGDGRERSPKRG